MNYNKNDLILAMNGDKDAFENLYKSIYMDLYKMSFYILGNCEIAKDTVGDTVLDAYVGISKLKDADNFDKWIMKILTVKCKKVIKDKYEKFSLFNPNVGTIDDYQLCEIGVADNNEEKTDIQIAISKLKKEERIIISLCVVQGYKSQEVAEIMGLNASTVRSKLNRGLAKIKKYLEVN